MAHLNPSPGTTAGTVVPGEATKANPAIGWGLLTAGAFCTYTAVAWSSPIPWQAQVAVYGMALAWPGDYSPRACLLACLRRRASEPADTPAQDRPAARVRLWACVTGAALAAGAWAWMTGRWWVPAGLVVTALGVIVNHFRTIFPRPGDAAAMTLLDLSSGGGAGGLAQWQAEVADRWYDGVQSVPSLVLRAGEETGTAEGRPIIGVAEIVDEVRPIPGGVAFAVDTRACAKVADDVAGAVAQIRRVIGATEVLVEPVPAVADITLVTAYRGQPWYGRAAVDWRGMRPITDGRDVLPVGETAHADLLDAAGPTGRRARRPVLSSRQAVLSSRTSLLIVAAAETGKTGLVRAYIRGLLVQGVPFLPVVLDNKGDYVDLAAAIRAMGGIYASNPLDYAAAVDWAWNVGESRYEDTPGYQHRPTLDEPLVQMVIAEWQDYVTWAKASKSMTALAQASNIPRRHRGSAVNLITTAQAAQQKELTVAREYFPQRVVMRVDNDTQVDMALGDKSLARGAHAHLIPHDAEGCFWAKDRRTGFPYQGRAAWIPEHDQTEALIRPMWELAKRMRTDNTGTRETA